MVTVPQLIEISQDVGYCWKILGRSLRCREEEIDFIDGQDKTVPEKALTLLLMWSRNMENSATVGLLVDCLREIKLGGVAEKLLG